ncbi:MAG TPA: FKBP-type peptidyl-prolyl cis-trans isomerase [Cellvibrionaceae bacterium]|nr:FKBP-type peptidyl-prolyl cis-trans isomerase [Cellvibrionaceae bacterium]HMW47554.1 FKBP-type peptidyl-prolyl cis-trans isomerase [Cellvibrionaceae bacterium]HMW70621.1 FKBP-type peptidyl-prolyl cis-trans isomerase [Cellvibrionaceae bacterium]HNG58710.1 FKBP-type peptidyl-prolyl cis-trans isomerase [Cellvibrionaceae bacterium]
MNTPFLRKSCLLSVAMASAVFLAGCNKDQDKAAAKPEAAPAQVALNTMEEKVSYIVGFRMASQAKASGFTLDKKTLSQAITDAQEGKDAQIPQEEQQKIMTEFQQQQETKHQEEMKKVGEENLKKGQDFIAENGKKEGVKTTASGLQYKVIKASEQKDAKSPKPEDTVKVHYHGKLIDGTVFDSSVDRGEPVTFPVNGVIPGWVEGLQLMKVGDKFELAIPANLAYGAGGTGPIPPNSALVFEVELLEINPKQEEAPANPHGKAAESAKPAEAKSAK